MFFLIEQDRFAEFVGYPNVIAYAALDEHSRGRRQIAI
jgi:hypothetical protein